MSRARSLDKIQNSDWITISELVQITSMRYSTLKYYTEEGLIPYEQLDSRLVRRYPRVEAIKRLNEINQLKINGLTIGEIKKSLGKD
ncbi:hypothetical protein D3C76_967290 [compost metagenome]